MRLCWSQGAAEGANTWWPGFFPCASAARSWLVCKRCVAVFQYHTIVTALKRYSIKFSSSIRCCSLTAAASLLSFFFLIQTVAILGLISGEPQKCGLLTFRNAKLWSDLVLCTHTHTDTHIPEGARWGWKQEVVKFTPARVRTVIYPHHSQGQQMWQDRVRKEWGG